MPSLDVDCCFGGSAEHALTGCSMLPLRRVAVGIQIAVRVHIGVRVRIQIGFTVGLGVYSAEHLLTWVASTLISTFIHPKSN